MATRSKEEKLQCLNCPMCLDVLSNATFLSCGHSFCKGCLEAYDKQHKDLNQIVCPVCRKLTKLDQERVAGLTPNFLAKGLEDILKVDVIAQSLPSKFCPLHSHVYKDIYCQPCGEFICLTCFIDSHQGHKIKKQEELEKELKTKRDALLEKSTTRKVRFEQCLSEALLQREIMNSHLSGLEREVKDAFAIKVVALQQNEEELLEKIEGIRKDLDKQLEGCICRCTEVIGKISSSVKLLTHHASKPLDHDMIKADHLRCADLEDSLVEVTDEESTPLVEEIKRNVQFCPAEDKLLALGCIDVSVNDIESNSSDDTTDDAGVSEEAGGPPASSLETGNATQHLKNTGRRCKGNRRGRKQQGSNNATGIPEAVKNNSMSIAKDFPFKKGTWFILAALSEYEVLVGYGRQQTGCDRFTLSGDKSKYLGREVGYVSNVACLSGGRVVISDHENPACVLKSVSGRCKRMSFNQPGRCVQMCTDQHDNIYTVSSNRAIYVFQASNPNPYRVVPPRDIQPRHIFVTTTGIMITGTGAFTPSTVTVSHLEGRVGTSIVATHDHEYMYATVDSLDRVLVATVVHGTYLIRLTRYRLQGIQLIEEVRFQPLKIPTRIQLTNFSRWLFNIVSLAPNRVAVATGHNLFFIHLIEM